MPHLPAQRRIAFALPWETSLFHQPGPEAVLQGQSAGYVGRNGGKAGWNLELGIWFLFCHRSPMEPTYTLLRGDDKQYGPITAEQFLAWAREGRGNGETQVRPSDSPAWVPASTVPALGGSAAPSATAVSAGPI